LHPEFSNTTNTNMAAEILVGGDRGAMKGGALNFNGTILLSKYNNIVRLTSTFM